MTGLVLVVDDDRAVRDALVQTLELADYDAIAAGSFIEAKDHIARDFVGVVLSDIRMPGRDGFHMLEHARRTDPDLPVILLTGEGDIPMAVRAMSEGAFDFLEKPCAPDALMAVLERALRNRALVLENRRLKAQLETGDPAARMIFGTSALAGELRARVRAAAASGADVLVCGAPGTGVSKVAEVIHLSSVRGKAPFVKRAAHALDRAGVLALLSDGAGGSLFLEGVGEMPMDAQLALLDAREAGHATRVIAGDTGDLAAAVAEGRMSADLYYRLGAVSVTIPGLAERPGDIPVLFRHYVAQASEQAGLVPPEITSEIDARLMAQDWPGNARALMSEAMRFALGLSGITGGADAGLGGQMAEVERALLSAALRRHGGQASAAARALRVPRKTFYDKLARYGLRPEDFR